MAGSATASIPLAADAGRTDRRRSLERAARRMFVHRFWGDEPQLSGLLVHRPGGRGGSTWAFEYGRGIATLWPRASRPALSPAAPSARLE